MLPPGSLPLMNPEELHTGQAHSRALRYDMLYVTEAAARPSRPDRAARLSRGDAADRHEVLGLLIAGPKKSLAKLYGSLRLLR
ncbi:AraC family ligand binding domain-containing protein [Pseudodonghicola flavimaris]|uniref:AraC family ligand binding domain-containing protein n=1 Tax=Pseudodonghicola flavimaris TaxID=3050036 RepID=A0ABT7F2N4_9RHOB|nr:AraC family ligand binding domain-containing protein [Pseudodonghicola flavimaris]MDK3018865.1 AraC family ligand binding domain-containing protein [Pseudodonghicola flavimaris]